VCVVCVWVGCVCVVCVWCVCVCGVGVCVCVCGVCVWGGYYVMYGRMRTDELEMM